MEPSQNVVDDNARSVYPAAEAAGDTRQAQQQIANDAPVDVNPNAIIAREQAGTFTLMGKNFEAGAMRFNAVAGAVMSRLMGEAPQPMILPKTAP